MTGIDLGSNQYTYVDLVQVPLLGVSGDRTPLRQRVAIGRPWFRQLTGATSDDDEVAAFIRSMAATTSFFLLSFAANFFDGDTGRFESARVAVLLEGDTNAAAPVARSLAPALSSKPVPASTRLVLKAPLKLFGFGVEVGAERETQATREEVFVRAAGEGCSDPEWVYHATRKNPLAGVNQMSLIAEVPAKTKLVAHIALSAIIRRPLRGSTEYRAELPDGGLVIPA